MTLVTRCWVGEAGGSPARVRRVIALDEDVQESFRGTLTGFCRAYAFVAQVMPCTQAELERLFLYRRLLLTELPTPKNGAMPQLSKSVQLNCLRLALTSEGCVALEATEQRGAAR